MKLLEKASPKKLCLRKVSSKFVIPPKKPTEKRLAISTGIFKQEFTIQNPKNAGLNA